MSLTRVYALVLGIVFVLVGIAGFIPALVTPVHPGDPPLGLSGSYGRLLGLFPVNVLHNLVHVALGVWALASCGRDGAARIFARGNAIIYAVLGVFGLIPGLHTLFGLVPLYSHDVWLHLVLAAIGAYFGWMAPMAATTASSATTPTDLRPRG
jgi:hypothetical protein